MSKRKSRQARRVEDLIECMESIPWRKSLAFLESEPEDYFTDCSKALHARGIIWDGMFWLDQLWQGAKYNAQRRK